MPATTASPAGPPAGIAPIEPPYPSAEEAWLKAAMPKDSPVPPLALFRVFARHLPLAVAMHPLGRWFLTSGGGTASLTMRQRELVILRTTALCGAFYEWSVHVQSYGERAALDADRIAATRGAGPDAPCWTADERLLLRAVDALHRDCDIPDALWPELRAAFDVRAQLEILFLSGWYRTISQVANAARVAPEPWAPLPEAPGPA